MKARIGCCQIGSATEHLLVSFERIAPQAPSAYTRKELLHLAASFEYRARHLGRYKE